MSTKLIRVPLAWPIGTRSGFSTSKDPFIKNGLIEPYGDERWVVKRPGTDTYITLGSGGTSQGITYYNGFYYGVVDDILYRSTGTNLTGTDGSAWTQTSPVPAWIGRLAFGSVVFQNRMWMIGGAPTLGSGIWSSQDGTTWAVNAGGQPWGFRSNMGCVVFNDQMWVLGGYNFDTASTFNDVWSTPDGTNWVNVSPDTGAITMWNTRYRHNAIATNNGMYVYGGVSEPGGTFYDDIWYSSDGVTWTQINVAVTGTGRADAALYWFNNKLWLIGGSNSAGVGLNDIWSSPDGVTWTNESAAAFTSGGRWAMQTCIYGGIMWAIGGFKPAANSDVFISTNGVTWFLVTNTPGWTARGGGAALVFRTPESVSSHQYETLWLISGDTGATQSQQVWYANINLSQATSFTLSPTTTQQTYQFNTYVNGQQLMMKNQSNFWVLQGSFLTKVMDSNYPAVTVPGLVVLGGFAYVMTPQAEIHACKLENPLLWPSLQFATADYEDDPGVALAKYLNYMVAFGSYTTQFFYDNSANTPEGFPAAPYINANLRVGCTNAESVANIANTLFWVAQTRQGTRYVAMLNGLQDQKISSVYVDKLLAATSVSSLVGFGAAAGGHFYYILKTGVYTALVYDITQQEWYEWDTFGYGAFISNGNTGGNYLFSTSGGNLVNFGTLFSTDVLNGNYDFIVQTDKTDFGNTAQKFYGRAVLVGDTNATTPGISWSDDDYATFSTARTVDMTLQRPYITRLGTGRRRAWRTTQTDDQPARFLALELEYDQGES